MKWMIKLTIIGFFLCIGLLLQTLVLAQDWGSWTGDIQKYCPSVKPGGGEVARCLSQHKDELSNGCKSRLSALTEQVKEADQTCQDDIMLVWRCCVGRWQDLKMSKGPSVLAFV